MVKPLPPQIPHPAPWAGEVRDHAIDLDPPLARLRFLVDLAGTPWAVVTYPHPSTRQEVELGRICGAHLPGRNGLLDSPARAAWIASLVACLKAHELEKKGRDAAR